MADHGLGLLSPLAVSRAGNVFAALEVTAMVDFGEHQLIGIEVEADGTQSLAGNPFYGRGFAGDEHAPSFAVAQEAIGQSPPAGQGFFELLLPVGKANPRENHMLSHSRIGQSHAQTVAAVRITGGHASLTPGRLVLRTEDEELVGPRLNPCLFPLGVRLESVLCQMKLGVEQLLRAEAQGNLVGLALRFPLLQTVFETSQAPPLLMKLTGAGLVFA